MHSMGAYGWFSYRTNWLTVSSPTCNVCGSSHVEIFNDQEFVSCKGNNCDIIERFDEVFCIDCENLDVIQRGTRRVYHDPLYKEPNGRLTSPSRHGT